MSAVCPEALASDRSPTDCYRPWGKKRSTSDTWGEIQHVACAHAAGSDAVTPSKSA